MAADISAPLKVEVQMSVYANNAERMTRMDIGIEDLEAQLSSFRLFGSHTETSQGWHFGGINLGVS